MAKPSRVFVVNEPLKVVGEGYRRAINISPALEYGDFVFLNPAGADVPHDPEASLPRMRHLLADFGPNDYLMPIGHPLLIAWASALAARAAGGRLQILHWIPQLRKYRPVRANVFATQSKEITQ